jgi:hypothetical protein
MIMMDITERLPPLIRLKASLASSCQSLCLGGTGVSSH